MSETAFKHTKATKKKQAQKNQKNDFTQCQKVEREKQNLVQLN